MKIHTLSPAPGSRKDRRRIGRGIGSGMGKTSTKGHKGQWARSGGGVRPGFEGGQMPLMRRMPKHGFDNAFKKVYSVINIAVLEQFQNGVTVDITLLHDMGLISKIEPYGLKVLGDGEFSKKLIVKAKKFTQNAKEKIEKAGGSAIIEE